MAAKSVVKFVVPGPAGPEVRRLRLAAGAEGDAPFSTLRDAAERAAREAVPGAAVSLMYKDDEGDEITISSDAELAEAFMVAEDMGKVLRVTVTVHGPTAVKPVEPVAKVAAPVEEEKTTAAVVAPEEAKVEAEPEPEPVAVQVESAAPSKDVVVVPEPAVVVEEEKVASEIPVAEVVAAPARAAAAEEAPEAAVVLGAKFVSHRSEKFVDELVCGAPVTEVWKMRNVGSMAWPEDTRLVHVGGAKMNAPKDGKLVGIVEPGTEVEVSVPLIIPAAPGRHVAYFRLAGAGGVRFGDRVWADVTIAERAGAGGSAAVASTIPTPSAPAATAAERSWAAMATEAGAAPRRTVKVTPRRGRTGDRWKRARAQLVGMGFEDNDVMQALLEHFAGDVSKIVERLSEMA